MEILDWMNILDIVFILNEFIWSICMYRKLKEYDTTTEIIL